MNIFYDPNMNNQIKAWYTHDTMTTTWEDLGYIKMEIEDPVLVAQIEAIGQDLRVLIDEGELVGVESWPRPVLSADLNPMPANGVAISTVTAIFADEEYAEDVRFVVNGGNPMIVAALAGQATLIFGPCEVVGIYEVRCISSTYGMKWLNVEVTDA